MSLGFKTLLEICFSASPRVGFTFGLQPTLIHKADLCPKNQGLNVFLFVSKVALAALKALV